MRLGKLLRGQLQIELKPGFGRRRCPVCGARPYTRCREPSYGRQIAFRDTRHFERYDLERQP